MRVADLHVHLEAAISPSLLRTLAERADVALPEGFGPAGFAWRDLGTFVRDYDVLCSVIRTASDYGEVAYDYLARSMKGFASRAEYEALLAREGFARVSGEDLTLGLAGLVTAERSR